MWRLEAEVHIPAGFSGLPVDMLRYDTCFPKDSMAVNSIGEGQDNPARVVRVVQYSNLKTGYWTPARWASFGVQLKPLPAETRKV